MKTMARSYLGIRVRVYRMVMKYHCGYHLQSYGRLRMENMLPYTTKSREWRRKEEESKFGGLLLVVLKRYTGKTH